MASGIYINNGNITGFGIRGTSSTGYISGTQFFPDFIRYTYTLSNVRIEYSTGYSLQPDHSNYARLIGTLTQKNGSTTIATATVPLVVTEVDDDIAVVLDNYIYWNKQKYAKTVKSQKYVKVSGYFINGKTRENYTATVSCAANKDDAVISSKIVEFTLDQSNPYQYKSYTTTPFVYARAERMMGYTSGEILGSSTVEMKSIYVNIDSDYTTQSQGSAAEAIYTFVNRGTTDLTISATLESRCEWWDPEHQMPDYDTDYDYETFVLPAGGTYTTRTLRADAGQYVQYPTTHSESYYYQIEDNYSQQVVGRNYSGYISKGISYFSLSTNAGSNAVLDRTTGQYTIKGDNLSGSSYYVMVKDTKSPTTAEKICYLTK